MPELLRTGIPAWPIELHRARAVGAKVFTDPYDINLLGIRGPSKELGAFDDEIVVLFTEPDGNWSVFRCAATLDPGRHYAMKENLLNPHGVARLKGNMQHRSGWTLGRHKGYPALQQHRPVTVERENDGSATWGDDPSLVEMTGMYAINIHAADSDPFDGRDPSVDPERPVGRWSAACPVIRDSVDYRFWWNLLLQQYENGLGRNFSLTIIEP